MTPLISGPRSGSLFGARNIGADAKPLGRFFCARSGRSPTARALLIALVVALAFVSPAEATRKKPADLKSQAAQTLVPNGERTITPAWWNAFVADMIDSGIPYFAAESNCYWRSNGPNAPASCEALTLGDATIDAGKIASGTISVARMPGNVARTDTAQSFTGVKTFAATPIFSTLAGGYLKTNGSGAPVASPTIPAADISGLAPSATTDATNAANISQGVFDPARLPSVVMRTNTAQVISGQKTFPTPPVFPSLSGYLKGNGPGQMTSVAGIPVVDIIGVMPSSKGGAGSVLGLLKADGNGLVSNANLLDFTGYAYAYQYSGIDPTGATNSQPGIQAMINATSTLSPVQLRGPRLYFGPGRFRVDDKTLLGAAQTLMCAGRNKTTFVVNSATFNMNAYAVFEVPPYSNAGAAKDCEVEFVQPNFAGMTRADLIKYPPAFFLNNAPGFIFDGIRCRASYRCIVALGNNGASDFGTIESGAAAPYQFAAFTADASGMTLHVTAVGSGQIAVPGFGYKVESTGVYTVYRIVNQLSGPTGGAGDYQLAWATSFSSGPNYQTDGGNVIDGALDFIRNQAFRCYPYGYLGSQSYAAFTDGSTSCLALGRADGFDFDNLSSSNAEVVLTPLANGHAHFASLELDSDMSRLRTFAGEPSIGFLALSSAGVTAREQVHAENSTITIDHLKNINNSSNCIVNVGTNGRIYILGGVLQNSRPDGKFLCFDAGATGGFARVANSMINNTGGTRTQPFFVQTGATNSMQLIDNARHANLSNGGPIYSYAADNFGNRVSGNHFYPQTHILPLSSNGWYETDSPDNLATPTIAFVTPGSSPIVVNSSSGKYWRKGDHVELELALDFKTPVATSEAGDLRISGTGMPWPRFQSETGCRFADAQKLVFAGPVFPIITHSVLSQPLVQFRQLVSGGASALLDPAGFPANTDHFIAKFHCSYPVQ